LKKVVNALGHFLTDTEISDLAKEVDEDGGGTLDFDEFLDLAARLDATRCSDATNATGWSQISDERAEEIKRIFTQFQPSRDGKIGVEDLKPVIRALGHSLTESELGGLTKKVNEDGSGNLDFDEYWLLAARLDDRGALRLPSAADAMSSARIDQLREIFHKFDYTGEEIILTGDLKAVIHALGVVLTRVELEEVIQETDEDGSGSLDFDEFLTLVGKLDEMKRASGSSAGSHHHTTKKIQQPTPLVAWLSSAEFDPGLPEVHMMMQEVPSTGGRFDSGRFEAANSWTKLQSQPQVEQISQAARIAACRRDLRAVIRHIDARLPKSKTKKS